ncbi:calpain-8-like [Pseudophryne corroboree]|uniref:calpain-8-like n=1 Tax=Pseudophryne corroboree TaxID=495146 RepID=UPI003081587A
MASIAATLAKDKKAALGVGTITNPVKYLNQDYEELKAKCLASGTLFEDPTFPASPQSLGYKDLGKESDTEDGIVWKRPAEIKPNPQFIADGATRGDVRQGALGDCWLLVSIASLTLNEECLCQVMPKDQRFDTKYAGIFHFKFWQYGEWVDVVVDDRLPTKKGKLNFVTSSASNEFWSALLEKAYAKINGSYEALKGGRSIEALEDFTGGVGEAYKCATAPKDLFQIIHKALTVGSFVTCSTVSTKIKGESVTSSKIVMNHAYSVTGAEEVANRGNSVQIIRVRNPWGYKEWTGAWSDSAPEWEEVNPKVKAKLSPNKCDDGETWMPFSTFLVEFNQVDICNLNLDTMRRDETHRWFLTDFKGSWTAGSNAGGCPVNATFWTNPQFRITLEDVDGDHKGNTEAPSYAVIVCLMQKGRRRKLPQGQGSFMIGFYIYKTASEVPMGKEFFQKNEYFARIDIYTDTREVSNRFLLPAGKYLIVPTTYNPNEQAEFCLRIFTEKNVSALEAGNVVDADPYEPEFCSPPDTESSDGCEDEAAEEGEYNVEEVRSVLNQRLLECPEIKSDGFSLRTCREMINLMDLDNTGTLSKEEFKLLWMKLENYMKIYLEVDIDHSGTIDAYEMRNALQKAGFTLNTRIQDVIARRYATKDLSIHFDDFIACMLRLETLLKMFNFLDTDKSGKISLSVSEWLCAGLI